MHLLCLSAIPSNDRALCLSAACSISFLQSCIVFKVGVEVILDNDLNCIPLALCFKFKFVRIGDSVFLGSRVMVLERISG